MKNFNKLLPPPLQIKEKGSRKLNSLQDQSKGNPKNRLKLVPKWWTAGILIFSFAGFLDSAYLTLKHYFAFQVPCSVVHGCEEVLGSSFAAFFGIPVALLGVLYYLAIFLAAAAFMDRGRFIFLKAVIALPFVGFFFTIWFVFVQAVLLQAFCLYCLLSAALTTGLFGLAVYYVFYGYRKSIGRARGV